MIVDVSKSGDLLPLKYVPDVEYGANTASEEWADSAAIRSDIDIDIGIDVGIDVGIDAGIVAVRMLRAPRGSSNWGSNSLSSSEYRGFVCICICICTGICTGIFICIGM